MKIINEPQGSAGWHAHRRAHRNASDAASMMGAGRKPRSALLHAIATGESEDVGPQLQALFDRGHEAEALARPIVEAIIGEELYPTVGVSDEHPLLSASFDGVTMDGETGFEHKLWNEALAESVRTGAIADDPAYYWQLEQQILVGGLTRVIFVVSDGTADRMETYTYTPRAGRAAQLVAGWAQFEADLAAYVPQVAKAAPVAAPVETLPAIAYTIDRGTMALTSNLPAFRAATEALIERTKAPLVTDQDFADREHLCKKMREAEAMLKAKADEVVGQINDVATFSRELKDLAEMFRAAALASEKLVEAEKKNRRTAIQQAGEQALAKHVAGLQERFVGRVQLPTIRGDFAGAIKGKRTLDSIQNAVDTELAQRKIEANAVADLISANLRALDELAPEHGFLFRDLQNLVTMPAEAFRATVEGRVATHKAQEAAKLAAEAERIERETRERIAREQEQRQAQQQPPATTAGTAPEVLTPATSAHVTTPAPATTAAPAKTGGMDTYAALRKTCPEMPSIPVLVGTISEAFGVSDAQAVRWLLTLNANDLNEYLKTTTEAQEA